MRSSLRYASSEVGEPDIRPTRNNLRSKISSCRQAPFTRYNLLSNRLADRFNNRLYRVYKHSSGCQTRLTTGLTTGCIVYTAGCQTCCQTVCTTRFDDNRLNEQWLFVQHGCQTGCQIGCTPRFDNRFDNRLNVCIHDTAGC